MHGARFLWRPERGTVRVWHIVDTREGEVICGRVVINPKIPIHNPETIDRLRDDCERCFRGMRKRLEEDGEEL